MEKDLLARHRLLRMSSFGLWVTSVVLLAIGVAFIITGAYPPPRQGGEGHAAIVVVGTVISGLAVLSALFAVVFIGRANSIKRSLREVTSCT